MAIKPIGIQHPTEILPVPGAINNIVLAANTAQAFDTPAGGRYVAFSANVDFWIAYGTTGVTIPTTNNVAQSSTGAELNPTARNFGSSQATTGFSLIAASAGVVNMAWYGN